MTYEWDIFLSYTRRASAELWVRENFYPVLRDCLDNSMPDEPKIFVDWHLETGVHWPDQLEAALRCARLVVSVISPPYFRSPWCLAEWGSIRARQEQLVTKQSPLRPALLVPVVYADGRHFPNDAKNITQYNFSRWNCPQPHDAFRATREYRDFHEAVKNLAEMLAARLPTVPEWDPDWPVIRPDIPPDPPAAALPRL